LQSKDKEQRLFLHKLRELSDTQQNQSQGLKTNTIQQRARSAMRSAGKLNQTVDEAQEKYNQKKRINENYSFLLGKSAERSSSTIKQRKMKPFNDQHASKNSNVTLPSMGTSRNGDRNYNSVNIVGIMKKPSVQDQELANSKTVAIQEGQKPTKVAMSTPIITQKKVQTPIQ